MTSIVPLYKIFIISGTKLKTVNELAHFLNRISLAFRKALVNARQIMPATQLCKEIELKIQHTVLGNHRMAYSMNDISRSKNAQ